VARAVVARRRPQRATGAHCSADTEREPAGRALEAASGQDGQEVDASGDGSVVGGADRRARGAYDRDVGPSTWESDDRPSFRRAGPYAVMAGSVVNQVVLVYDGLGQVIQSRQEHDGEVDNDEMDEDSLKVAYDFSEVDDGDPLSRLTSIRYPASNRMVYLRRVEPAHRSEVRRHQHLGLQVRRSGPTHPGNAQRRGVLLQRRLAAPLGTRRNDDERRRETTARRVRGRRASSAAP